MPGKTIGGREDVVVELLVIHWLAVVVILVAAGRKKEGLAMVTAMEDACPSGAQEEGKVMPPGQPGVEGPLAMLSTQEPDTSGGEEQRKKRSVVTYLAV